MDVQLHSTTKKVTLNGLECRVWEGTTKAGIACHAFIPVIAAHETANLTEFDSELTELRTPTADVEALPARMVL